MVSGGQLVDGRPGTMPVISPGDYDTPPPPSNCGGCGGQITDRFYLHAAERQWHATCLMCFRCKAPLDQAMSCYFRDGHIYCKEDYYRLFAVRSCSRCQNGIFASELVMRAKELVFHLHCFTCAWCNTSLTQGDLFGLRGNLVYCRIHYEMLAHDPYPSPPEDHPASLHPHHPDEGMMPERHFLGYGPFSVESGPVNPSGRKGRPRKKKNGDLSGEAIARHNAGMSPIDPTGCNLHLSHLDGTNSSQSSPPLSSNGGQRTKRMRTSFKHHQLRTMKSYFSINQNPDAKDLKQLAQKTGLSKRVLQVWFQNARAKWRRNNVKQEPMPGLMGSDHSPNSQMHQGSLMGGQCSPGARSYNSDTSPNHSCGGIPSDGSLSTQVGPTMDFDSSNPLTPLVSHHGLNSGSVHNGESVLHMTSFPEIY